MLDSSPLSDSLALVQIFEVSRADDGDLMSREAIGEDTESLSIARLQMSILFSSDDDEYGSMLSMPVPDSTSCCEASTKDDSLEDLYGDTRSRRGLTDKFVPRLFRGEIDESFCASAVVERLLIAS